MRKGIEIQQNAFNQALIINSVRRGKLLDEFDILNTELAKAREDYLQKIAPTVKQLRVIEAGINRIDQDDTIFVGGSLMLNEAARREAVIENAKKSAVELKELEDPIASGAGQVMGCILEDDRFLGMLSDITESGVSYNERNNSQRIGIETTDRCRLIICDDGTYIVAYHLNGWHKSGVKFVIKEAFEGIENLLAEPINGDFIGFKVDPKNETGFVQPVALTEGGNLVAFETDIDLSIAKTMLGDILSKGNIFITQPGTKEPKKFWIHRKK